MTSRPDGVYLNSVSDLPPRSSWLLAGGFIGLGFFLADLVGAFLAIGSLFEPTAGAFGLLAAAGAAAAVAGAAIGLVLSWIPWRRIRSVNRLTGHWRWVVPAAFLIIAAGGFLERAGGRHLSSREPAPPADGIPILLIVVDALRADTLYGQDRSFPEAPNVGRWARESLVFADAESAAGWTIPSVATLMTGIHPTTMDASAGRVPGWAPTLPEHLRARGYATHAVVDNMTLEPRNGFARGFDTFTQRSSFRFAFSLVAFRILPERWQLLLRARSRTFYQGAEGTTAAAVARIHDAAERPLFLYVHYMDPHAPYLAHPGSPDPEEAEAIDFYAYRDRLVERRGPAPSAGQMLLLRHRYRGEVRHFDAHLDRLLLAWREKYGRRGLVLLTADHGEEFMDHGGLGHGVTLHREMVWVPLILELPESQRAALALGPWVEQPVGQIDIAPTVLDLAGYEPLRGPSLAPIQGRSLLPWLLGRAQPESRPLLASHSRNGRRVHRLRQGNRVCQRTMYYDGRPTEYALYDLQRDPAEHRELPTSAGAGEMDPMTGQLDTLAKLFWRSFTPTSEDDAEASLETLRAMGYIQ